MKTALPNEPADTEFKQLRELMQWTQAEAAHFLGVSKKAVESYEQGWRKAPDALWKEFLLIIALKRGYPNGYKRCYEVMRCSPAVREACFCARNMRGLFCWATCQATCMRHLGGQGQTIKDCLHCPVARQFLGEQPPRRGLLPSRCANGPRYDRVPCLVPGRTRA